MFKEGDYVRGKEKVGLYTIREMSGWVRKAVLDDEGVIKGYEIQCDDEWNGNRANCILYEYGDIIKEYTDRRPNNRVNSY